MKLILGSKSPRRKELLEGLNIPFEIRTKDTDESYPDGLQEEQVAEFIAQNKVNALTSDLKDDEIILCADTIVLVDKTILGKPKDVDQSRMMLEMLSNKTHRVITGVAIANKEKNISFSTTTEVTFKQLTPEEINYYIENFNPFDKAGSYGIQEWIGYIGVSNINGSYFNVVGLPIHEVYKVLKEEF